MNVASAADWTPSRPSSGFWGRLWGAVRRTFVGTDAPRRGQLALARPVALPNQPPTGEQARDLKYGTYQDHPGYGCTPQRVVSIFRDAECGFPATQCDLIDDVVERDCTLRNLLEQREQAVAGKPHVIQAGGPAEADELAARVLAAALEALPLIGFFQHQLSFNRYGYAASEIDWGTMNFEGRDWVVPIALTNVPARRFRIDTRTDQLKLITDAHPEGEPLEVGKWCITTRPGTLARSGLMRTAIWPALWKGFSTRDWVVYAEMFGIPLIQATYDDAAATDDPSRIAAETIVQKMGSSGGAVTPKSIEVKVHETRAADNTGTHAGLIAFSNAEMAKLINGSTLANDNAGSGGASYALGEVHDSVRWDNVLYDAGRLEETVRTQVGAAFLRFNALVGVKSPVLRVQVVRDLQPKVRLECADLARNKLGIPLSVSQLRQETGFREPLGDDDEAVGAAVPAAAAPAAEPARAA